MTEISRRAIIAAGGAMMAAPAAAQSSGPAAPRPERGGKGADILGPVSYTHLTLPTKA